MAKTKHDENEWAAALCIQFDPEMWFTVDDAMNLTAIMEETTTALKLCNECPLREKCAVEGLQYDNIRYGIWGGLLAGERMDMAGMNRFAGERAAVTKAKNVRRQSRVKRKPNTSAIRDAALEAHLDYKRSGNYVRATWRLENQEGSEV